jgi:membrane protein YdbS with pleckstrin-like domain
VHTSILLLLVSGSYNAVMNWHTYSAMTPKGLGHGLFGIHVLLALIVLGVLLWLFIGSEPRKSYLRWLAIDLLLMFLTIAAASTLKYARDSYVAHSHSSAIDAANL